MVTRTAWDSPDVVDFPFAMCNNLVNNQYFSVSVSPSIFFFQKFSYFVIIYQVFGGNSDHNTVVRHVLREPFITKQLSIRPIKWKGTVGLRMEIYGCKLGKL